MKTRIAPPLAPAALAAALLLAGCTVPEQVRSPVWVGPASTPDGQELTPERAALAEVNGHVVLLCRSHAEDGRLTDCRIAYESPRGWGFGAAALRVSANVDVRRTRLGPVRPDGLVLLPVRFCADGSDNCLPGDGPWPIHMGDPRLADVPKPPPVVRP